MLRKPIFLKTFGNIEIKIWCYPKEILKCLLKGLSCNSKTFNKVVDVVCFRHSYYEDFGGCNCQDKVEDICFRYSITIHREGKLYIPLEIIDYDSQNPHVFISELRSIAEPCKSNHKKAINIVSELSGCCKCLLRLPIDNTNSGIKGLLKDNSGETERLKRCYEKIIKKLVKNSFIEEPCNRNQDSLEKNDLLEICLQNNISSEKIVSLLKDLTCNKRKFSCNKKEEIICRTCQEAEENCRKEHSNNDKEERMYRSDSSMSQMCDKKMRNIPMAQNNPFFTNDADQDCQRSSSVEFSHNDIQRSINPCGNGTKRFNDIKSRMRSKNSYSHLNRDINEIKSLLNNIETTMNFIENLDCKTYERVSSVKNGDICGESKKLNAEEILHAILQHVSQCNYEKAGISEMKKINDCEEDEKPETFEPQYENKSAQPKSLNETYKHFQQSTSLRSNRQSTNIVPTLDAYDSKIESTSLTSKNCFTSDHVKQKKAIQHALQSAGISEGLSDYISKLTPSEFHDGVTNIYYYINSNTGEITKKSNQTKKKIQGEPEFVTEQKRSLKECDNEDNLSSGYSHIIVDINIQETEDQNMEFEEQNQINDDIIVGHISEPYLNPLCSINGLKTIEQSTSLRNSKSTQPPGSMRSSKGIPPLDSNILEGLVEETESVTNLKGETQLGYSTHLTEPVPLAVGSWRNSKPIHLSCSPKNSNLSEVMTKQADRLKVSNESDHLVSPSNSNAIQGSSSVKGSGYIRRSKPSQPKPKSN